VNDYGFYDQIGNFSLTIHLVNDMHLPKKIIEIEQILQGTKCSAVTKGGFSYAIKLCSPTTK
jgi:hypothetical protein